MTLTFVLVDLESRWKPTVQGNDVVDHDSKLFVYVNTGTVIFFQMNVSITYSLVFRYTLDLPIEDTLHFTVPLQLYKNGKCFIIYNFFFFFPTPTLSPIPRSHRASTHPTNFCLLLTAVSIWPVRVRRKGTFS